MRIDVITIFPELFDPFLRTSLVGRAVVDRLLEVAVHDLRDHAVDSHRSVDDEPYGGGGGMVMTAPPWIAAVGAVSAGASPWRILLTPQGATLTDAKVRELAARPHLLLLCGRYEGLDERVAQTVVDEEISIGDYVLAGGEVAAMVVIEAVSRWIPGVVGLPDSVESDSFRHGLLDYPHYTRPREVAGIPVPEVLLSGDHRAIAQWRRRAAERRTLERRPDLWPRASPADRPAEAGDRSGATPAARSLESDPARDRDRRVGCRTPGGEEADRRTEAPAPPCQTGDEEG